jgi:hypothetical protein
MERNRTGAQSNAANSPIAGFGNITRSPGLPTADVRLKG